MKYVVLAPHNKLMCFEHPKQVQEYCLEKDNEALNNYCTDQELSYETMTSVEVGYAYAATGGEHGGCKIYETKEVLHKLGEYELEASLIEGVRHFFDNEKLTHEVDCPSYLEDIFMELDPIPVSLMTEGIYVMENIDAGSSERTNPGI